MEMGVDGQVGIGMLGKLAAELSICSLVAIVKFTMMIH